MFLVCFVLFFVNFNQNKHWILNTLCMMALVLVFWSKQRLPRITSSKFFGADFFPFLLFLSFFFYLRIDPSKKQKHIRIRFLLSLLAIITLVSKTGVDRTKAKLHIMIKPLRVELIVHHERARIG